MIAAPPQPINGLVVTRDGEVMTAALGTTVPVDPGDREPRAQSPHRDPPPRPQALAGALIIRHELAAAGPHAWGERS